MPAYSCLERHSHIHQQVLAYIQRTIAASHRIEESADLIQLGVLDSLTLMDIIAFIEAEFGLALSASDIAPRHFRSVESIVHLIQSKGTDETQPPRSVR